MHLHIKEGSAKICLSSNRDSSKRTFFLEAGVIVLVLSFDLEFGSTYINIHVTSSFMHARVILKTVTNALQRP